MRIGIVKSYILHEAKLGDLDLRIMRSDSSGDFLLQVDKGNKTIVRKKVSSKSQGMDMIKKARMYSDHPTAFDETRREKKGPGGFLDHVIDVKDENNKKKKRKKKEKPNNAYDDGDQEGDGIGDRVKLGPDGDLSRDDGYDTGFGGNQDDLEGKGKSHETPPTSGDRKPIGEFSLDVMENPQEYKVQYDNVIDLDKNNPTKITDVYNRNLQKKKNRQVRQRSQEDSYTVKRPDGKVRKKVPYNKAVELSRKYPNSKIEKD
jgi:hypothetical protein